MTENNNHSTQVTPTQEVAEASSTPVLRPSREPKICKKCNASISGQFVRALGAHFHLDCFRCQDCDQVVAEKFFSLTTSDGQSSIFCEKDYFKRLDLLCAKCGGALRGPHINALSKKYHLEHFSCSVCTTVFRPHDSYYEREGQVFCQFHYSVLFATKCKGCQTAVLQKFVEMNKDGVNEQWHPSCYMIFKLWGVKLASSRQSVLIPSLDEVAVPEDDSKRQQLTVEKADRVFSVLSKFEESSAECISEMLLSFSNQNIEVGVQQAGKFIYHVEALFMGIERIESQLLLYGDKSGLQLNREPKQLAKKIVSFFSMLSQTRDTQESTKELIGLVTNLAHVLKMLIRASLNGSLKLERNFGIDAVAVFLDILQLTEEVTDTTERMLPSEVKNDLCPVCKKSVEEECFRLDSRRWHSQCFNCARCGSKLEERLQFAFCLELGNDIEIFCHDCCPPGSRTGFERVSQLEQYVFLLRCALKRLCLLLKARDPNRSHDHENRAPSRSQFASDQNSTSSRTKSIENADTSETHDPIPLTPIPQKPVKYISELNGLSHLVVRQWAVMQMHPLVASEIPDLDQLMEYIETKKPSMWSQLASSINPSRKKPKDGTFGIPLDVLIERYGVDSRLSPGPPTRIPLIVEQCISHLRQMDLKAEGIFRKSGNIRRLKMLTESLDRDPLAIDLKDDNPIQIAALLKKFLRDLPEPLLTYKLHKLFILSQKMETEEQRKEVLHLVLCLLPKPNLDLLIVVCNFLREVASFSEKSANGAAKPAEEAHSSGNRMHLVNLSKVITPNILYSKSKNPVDDEALLAIECFSMLLRFQDDFWLIPKYLARELETWPDFANVEHVSSREVMREMLERVKIQPEETVPEKELPEDPIPEAVEEAVSQNGQEEK
ncbi:hypothetical protein HK098_000326 [Nowakowskiella sp. JEL0407]|nr:hypothetical protein HK098_000326 [Nowakowskiella sp. JEL0407]